MTTASRINTGYNDWFPVPGRLPNTPDGFSWVPGPRGLYDPGEPQRLKSGEFIVTLPTDPSTYPDRPASRVRTFFDDYYNRVHLTPMSLDYGAISSDAEIQVYIWNAYIKEIVALLSVEYDPGLGLRVEGAPTPSGIAPLGATTYRVIATADGPAMLSGEIEWVFQPWESPGLSIYTTVSGSRVRVYGFRVAWPPTGQPFRVTHSFSTAIFTSRSGKEQRIANRTRARKNIAFQVHAHRDSLRRIKDELRYWQHRAFCLPDVTRKVLTASAMGVGDNTVLLESVPAWIVPGAQVILSFRGFSTIRQIEEVTDNEVLFLTRSDEAWPEGTTVYSGLTGNLKQDIRSPRHTNDVATINVDFDVTPLSEPVEVLPDPSRTFAGREVFLRKPNWANAVEVTFSHTVEVLDYGRGPITRETPVDFGTEARRATYLNRTYDEAEAIRGFFYRMKGRQGEFYMPTWEPDFKPMVPAQPGTQTFRVAGTEFATMYADSTVHKAMFVQMSNGDVLLREITAIEPVSDLTGDDSLITVNGAWDREISEDTIDMAGWLLVSRFVSDDLTVEWLTDTVANVQLTVMSLENLPAE